jgi:hypothetical protein
MARLIKIIAIILATLVIGSLSSPQNTKAASTLTLTCIGNTESTLTFSWIPVNDTSIIKYTLYESRFDLHTVEDSSGPYFEVWSTTNIEATTATIIVNNQPLYPSFGYTEGITHYFYISASNGIENVSKSDIIKAKPTSPPNPNLYVDSRTNNSITIRWVDYNNYTPQVPFNSYTIQVSTSGENGTWNSVATITEPSVHSYTLTDLDVAQFHIRVYDTAGLVGNTPTSFSNVVAYGDDSSTNSSSASPSPNSTTSVPEFSFLTILPLLLTTTIALLIIVRKRLQRST